MKHRAEQPASWGFSDLATSVPYTTVAEKEESIRMYPSSIASCKVLGSLVIYLPKACEFYILLLKMSFYCKSHI